MRLTPQKLWNWARETVQTLPNRDQMLAVYLIGSLLSRSPLLGNITDVDLVCIWNGTPEQEITLLTPRPGVLIDIRHEPRTRFEPARTVRTHPWLGPEVFVAYPLWDPFHFLERIQAAVRSHFHDPEAALTRAVTLLRESRDTWVRLETYRELPTFVDAILHIVFRSAHIPATLRGYILPPRRFLWALSTLSQMYGQPQWLATILHILGAPQSGKDVLQSWLQAWEADFDRALETHPRNDPILHPARKPYYLQGFQAFLQGDTPTFALYPLLWTWTQAVLHLPESLHEPWETAIHTLGLDRREAKIEALDAWLDTMETFLETWAQSQGLELSLAL